MRIQFEIKEKLPDIIGEILNSEKWMTLIKEDISGRKLVVIRDQAFDSEATVEIYSREVTIKTAWSRYTYRLFVLGDCVWCEYNGAYRGLLEQKLLPSITPKESLLDSEVLDSSLYGHEKKKLREYAEDNLKLKKFRRENFNENRTGVAPFDHPKKVYDEFIKEDYIYNPQIQISAESGTKRSNFRQKDKTKRSKKRLHTTLIKPEQKVNEDLCSGFIVS